MYEKDGEKYFVVDAHMHYWDASRENWREGREDLAKGWIDCFYGYHQLGPPETHWDYEKYLKVSEEDLMRDVFEEGYVDKAIFQSTYLKYWYTEGFNTTDRNGSMLEEHADKFIVNGRFDPRDGEAGLKQLEEDARRWNLKGVKVYTAEWHENGSRGWKLSDPESYRFLEKCRELGIKNIHAHKGPTIWPLNKDAFSTEDVDQAATDFTDLNFIIEHVGHPADRRLRLHGGAGAERLRRPLGGHRRPHAHPAEVLREGDGRAAVLGRRRSLDLRQRLQHLGAQVAGRGVRRLADAGRRGLHRLPAAHHGQPRRRSSG